MGRPATPVPGNRLRRAALLAAVCLAAGGAATSPALAKVYLSQEQALDLAFGDASRAERRTAYLTDEQAAGILERAGSEPGSRVVVYYEAKNEEAPQVTAYFDTHLVRTLPETVMVVVGPDSRVARVDLLSFDEPEDYLPKRRWLDQFNGRPLDDELSTSRSIRAVTGATISSRVITATVRRVLALHAVLSRESAEEKAKGAPAP
jgi:hypothetical protein